MRATAFFVFAMTRSCDTSNPAFKRYLVKLHKITSKIARKFCSFVGCFFGWVL